MKFRSILALIVLLALVAPVSGQTEYQIRINTTANLRAGPSIESAKIGTVASGTTLTVVGERNQWLKLDWRGKEAWMANWLDHRRVDPLPELSGFDADFDPYTLFSDCDPDEFQTYATLVLNALYLATEIISSPDYSLTLWTYHLWQGARTTAHHAAQESMLPCRQAVELNILAQQIIADFYIVETLVRLRADDILDPLARNLAKNAKRPCRTNAVLQRSPFRPTINPPQMTLRRDLRDDSSIIGVRKEARLQGKARREKP